MLAADFIRVMSGSMCPLPEVPLRLTVFPFTIHVLFCVMVTQRYCLHDSVDRAGIYHCIRGKGLVNINGKKIGAWTIFWVFSSLNECENPSLSCWALWGLMDRRTLCACSPLHVLLTTWKAMRLCLSQAALRGYNKILNYFWTKPFIVETQEIMRLRWCKWNGINENACSETFCRSNRTFSTSLLSAKHTVEQRPQSNRATERTAQSKTGIFRRQADKILRKPD